MVIIECVCRVYMQFCRTVVSGANRWRAGFTCNGEWSITKYVEDSTLAHSVRTKDEQVIYKRSRVCQHSVEHACVVNDDSMGGT